MGQPHNPEGAVQPRRLTILVTRPQPQADRFAALCRARFEAAPIVVAPLIRIEERPLGAMPEGVRGLVFTSEAGVKAFAAQCARRDLPAWCVGERTASAARAAGFTALAAGGTARALVEMIVAAAPPGPLLHLRGVHAACDVASVLARRGVPADAAVIYDQLAQPLTPRARELLRCASGAVVAPVFSPRSARMLAEAAANARAVLRPVAISANAAQAWAEYRDDPVLVAAGPHADAVLGAMAQAMQG